MKHEIKIHDRNQFEIKLHYEFRHKWRKTDYLVETYFFVPNSLGINKLSYHKKNFYDSVKNYIRFSTPEYSLTDYLDGNNSPLAKIQKVVQETISSFSDNSLDAFEYEIKMFTTVFALSIKEGALEIMSYEKIQKPEEISNYIDLVNRIYEKYRELEELLQNCKELLEIFGFSDEYISLVIERFFFEILDRYKKKNLIRKDDLTKKILKLIKKEIERRKLKKYDSIAEEDSSNEKLLFRFSALKKYFGSVLSLDANVEKEGTILEHFLFSIAAGLAMFFATGVAFWGQMAYGRLTMPFFVLLVVSYMFKDRIKEIMRVVLKRLVFKYLFDYKFKLFINEKEKVGIIKESFDFIKSKKLDRDVYELRQLGKTPEFDNKFQKEKVILYRKKIKLSSRYMRKYGELNLNSITDIFRFDVSRFLTKMDDRKKMLFVLTENGYKKIFGKRVYHVNLIQRIFHEEGVELKRYRLVLTKKGIDRIEPVAN